MLLLMFVFLVSSVSAVSTDMKDEYEQGETMSIEISGNILGALGKDSVDFLRGHVSVPLDFDLRKLENKYYLWAIMPTNENNYTLVINDIETTVNGKNAKIDFKQNFSVSGNLTDYSIRPGFIFAKDDFSINIQLNKDEDLEIKTDFPSERNLNLKSGENEIEFDISSVQETGLKKINVGKYTVPAYIVPEKNASGKGEFYVRVFPEIIESTVLIGDKTAYPFRIINIGEEVVDEITLEYDQELFSIMDTENIAISPGEAVELNISYIGKIDNDIKERGISDDIIIVIGKNIIKLPITIKFTEDEGKVDIPYLDKINELKYCTNELKGKICIAGEVCDGETQTSFEGACCIGSCSSEVKKSDYSWIGWVIAAIALLIVLYAYSRYKKTKSRSGIEESMKRAESKLKSSLP